MPDIERLQVPHIVYLTPNLTLTHHGIGSTMGLEYGVVMLSFEFLFKSN